MPRRKREIPTDKVAAYVYHLSHSRIAFTVDTVAHYAKCEPEVALAVIKAGVADEWCYKTHPMRLGDPDLYVGKL